MLLALFWLLPFLTLFRLARRQPDVSRIPPDETPKVTVIIPARNEAATIETVVRSVLASTYPQLELLVVDDCSTDETGAIVQRLAQGEPRLRLLHGEARPEGWFGKPWACEQGARAAGGEVLVFTDADTRHRPALLGHAVGALQREQADLVTLSPRQLCLSPWERLVMPQVWLLLGLRYHPDAVNRASRARDVIANGQFIMVRRSSYEAVGGHAAVRGEVTEDLALAQVFWGAGRRIFFAFAEHLMETRMYHDLPHLIEGWSKNLYLGSRRSLPDEPLLRALVPALLLLAMLYWLLPPLLLLFVAAGLASPALLAPAWLATAASAAFWWVISIGMRIPPWYGLGYPLGALMTGYIILRSTRRGAARIEWKGRTYDASLRPDG